MTQASRTSLPDTEFLGQVLARVAEDLEVITGRDLKVARPAVTRESARPAGMGVIHISFRMALTAPNGSKRYGSLLVPLPEAITLACSLLMVPEESITERRQEPALDPALKDAILEIGNMIGGASNRALEELGASGWSLRSEGCQGVRADIRPAFPYKEGSALAVARAKTTMEPFPAFELIVMLPPIE